MSFPSDSPDPEQASQTAPRPDSWEGGAAYETYVGRWSRPVARTFLEWLDVPPGVRWLDVGCGTGALSQLILERAAPAEVKGIDPSEAFIAYARHHITDGCASFTVGDAQQLPVESSAYDVVVSGLALNFIPDKSKAAHEFARVARKGGLIAAYVWDYADQMQMMRHFWNAAIALHPESRATDEAHRFPICNPEPLAALFQTTGLKDVEVRSIDIRTLFRDFDDYWTPFFGGTGPAPTYLTALSETDRAELRREVAKRLPVSVDGSIDLLARAWAVRGRRA